MKITAADVLHVAKLARLKINEDDLEQLAIQLGGIIQFVDSLETVDTEGVLPTTHAVFTKNAFRPDDQKDSLDRTGALKNAPQAENGFFVVPKIID
jgi:aspartyl-tRNA(Asn)/glutamyl-tRNA(Gln) amidotransferase subunit C